MNSKPNLKIDWCSYEAAKYACEHWHYSGCLAVGKLVKIGAWEDGRFIGCVIFARGATPHLAKPYGLQQTECVELVRIAMTEHRTPVSKIGAIALKFLKNQSPGVRLVVSFADPSHGHHGGIYQAMNWIFTGDSASARFFRIHGELTHPRTIGSAGGEQTIAWVRANLDPNAELVDCPGKHRYIFPLDEKTRGDVLPLAKPYPKRAPCGVTSDSAGPAPTGQGGASPTTPLQLIPATLPQVAG